MEILPLYQRIVGLQEYDYKSNSHSVAHSSLRIETSQAISLFLSKRLSFIILGYFFFLLMIKNEGSYPYLYYSTSTMNGGDYLYPRVEIDSLECSTLSRNLYTLSFPSTSFHTLP